MGAATGSPSSTAAGASSPASAADSPGASSPAFGALSSVVSPSVSLPSSGASPGIDMGGMSSSICGGFSLGETVSPCGCSSPFCCVSSSDADFALTGEATPEAMFSESMLDHGRSTQSISLYAMVVVSVMRSERSALSSPYTFLITVQPVNTNVRATMPGINCPWYRLTNSRTGSVSCAPTGMGSM